MNDSSSSDPFDRRRQIPGLPNLDSGVPPANGTDPQSVDPGSPDLDEERNLAVEASDELPEDDGDAQGPDHPAAHLNSDPPSQDGVKTGPGRGRPWADAKRYEAEMDQVFRDYANAVGEAAAKQHRRKGHILLLEEAWHQGWTDDEMKLRLDDFSAKLQRVREGLLVFRIYQRVRREYPDKPPTQDELRGVVQSELDHYGYRRAPEGASGASPITEGQQASESSSSHEVSAGRAASVTSPPRPTAPGGEIGQDTTVGGPSSGDLRPSGKRPSVDEAAITVLGDRHIDWTPEQWRRREAAYDKRAKAEEQAETHANVRPVEALPDGTTASVEMKPDGSWNRRSLTYNMPGKSEPSPMLRRTDDTAAAATYRKVVGAGGEEGEIVRAEAGHLTGIYLDAGARPFVYVPQPDGKTLTPLYLQEVPTKVVADRKSHRLLEGFIQDSQMEPAKALASSLLERGLITDQDILVARRAYATATPRSSPEQGYSLFQTILNSRAKERAETGQVKGAEGGRALTQDEIDVIQRAFGSSIDLTDVTIVYGPGMSPLAPIAFDNGNEAITDNNMIYLDPVQITQKLSEDLTRSPKGIALLSHEMHHVRQYQTNGTLAVWTSASAGAWWHGKNEAYRYYNRNRTFLEESLEGQSKIVGDYVRYRETGEIPNYDMKGTGRKMTPVDLEKWARGSGVYGK